MARTSKEKKNIEEYESRKRVKEMERHNVVRTKGENNKRRTISKEKKKKEGGGAAWRRRHKKRNKIKRKEQAEAKDKKE